MIAVLTKSDTLKLPVVHQLMKEHGLTIKKAMPKVADFAAQMLNKLKGRLEKELNSSKYPPKDYVAMSSRSLTGIWCYNHLDSINMIIQI